LSDVGWLGFSGALFLEGACIFSGCFATPAQSAEFKLPGGECHGS
jgi:hypothetical protein